MIRNKHGHSKSFNILLKRHAIKVFQKFVFSKISCYDVIVIHSILTDISFLFSVFGIIDTQRRISSLRDGQGSHFLFDLSN